MHILMCSWNIFVGLDMYICACMYRYLLGMSPCGCVLCYVHVYVMDIDMGLDMYMCMNILIFAL